MDPELYRCVAGLQMHHLFQECMLRSAYSYKPLPGDIFVVTYPKSRTTLTQYLILSIFSRGNPPKTLTDFMLASPFLELMDTEAAKKMVRPGVLKTHLPFCKVPYSTDAKYIYVARNPYDVCVSFYFHTKAITPRSAQDVSFARFHGLFLSGTLSYGDYFDNLLPWYEQRDNPNDLFLTYKQMNRNTAEWLIKIADFLGGTYGNELRKDPALIRKLLEMCGLQNMKSVFNERWPMVVEDLLRLPLVKALKSMGVYREVVAGKGEMHEGAGFVRKGIVGDWKRHFTPQLIETTKAWIERKTT